MKAVPEPRLPPSTFFGNDRMIGAPVSPNADIAPVVRISTFLVAFALRGGFREIPDFGRAAGKTSL
jgi:hypothetical protein